MKTSRMLGAVGLAGALGLVSRGASAHPVTVDGAPTEWSSRLADTPNVGLVARTASGAGEFVWRDAGTDTRTDVATPEVVADIFTFQVTGDANGLSFLLRRLQGVAFVGAPIQVQVAIDLDRVAGSGQSFLAGFADTTVADGARWERLVQTLFGSGGAAHVIDTSFNEVATVPAMQGPGGDVEISVPWSALGLAGPPPSAVRLTVATFRARADDLTVDIGGPTFSNALDVVTNYGDPTASNHPNTFAEVQDGVVDHSFDLWFSPTGEVYAPLVVQSLLPISSGGGGGEWIGVRNVTPGPLSVAGFKVGDATAPDGAEGVFSLPATMLAAGATYTIARQGGAYQTFFGAPPDAEIAPGSVAAAPDVSPYLAWSSGTDLSLDDPGDEVVVLDPSNTLVDIAAYKAVAYPGVTTYASGPGLDQVLSRAASSSDTDDCELDFSASATICATDAQCGGACFACVAHVCGPRPPGAACLDANACNGDETCNGAGVCVAGAPPDCDDSDPCSDDTCIPSMGCTSVSSNPGTPCSDGNACNGAETCSIVSACVSPGPLDCDDQNACTDDACDTAAGCTHTDAAVGAPCDDGDPCTVDACDGNGACVSTAGGCGGAGGASSSTSSASSSAVSTTGATSSASTAASGSTGSGTSGATTSSGSSSASGSSSTSGGGGSGGAVAEGGCDCQVGGAGEGPEPLAWLAAFAMAGAIVARRARPRRR